MWILGHRGASKDAPENTLLAFELAMQQGANGIEFDTYQIDDEVMVIHDRWLDRTTSGTGLVTNYSVPALRELDAGQGQRIPLLSEALTCLPATAVCNVEIKHLTDASRWLTCFRTACAESQLSLDNIIVSSFNHNWLKQLKHLEPTLQLGALTATYPENGVDFAVKLSAYSVHMAIDVVDEAYVKAAQELGLKVLVYTVDYADDMRQLQQWGVDGIFTNVPELARQTLA